MTQPPRRRRLDYVAGVAAFFVGGIVHAQVIFTEVMHSPGGADALWEWVEVLNVTGAPVDLDGWVFDDDDDPGFTMPNISSAGGTRNTMVPAGGVAVLYPGDELDFMPQRFLDAWGEGITLIGVDGFTTLTSGDAIGLWSSHASYLADAIPGATSSPRRTFANAVAAIDYSSGFPTAAAGHSIAWHGSGSAASGANWVESQPGVLGAFASVETTIESAQINSTNDRGNPGRLPAGTPAAGLLITEVMFAPDSPLVTVGYTSTDFEWVEVLNNTPSAISFAATPYVFDDIAGGQLTSANVNSGSLEVGGIGIFFNNARLSTGDMQAMWGTDWNFIPVERWPALNNAGGDTIALWDSLAAYNAEPTTGSGRSHDNAVAAVTYNTVAGEGWPTISTGSSIWLNNLGGDPNVGANWTRAGVAGDTLTQNASPIFQTAIDHPGGDVGSPGLVPGATPPPLSGDFNGDGRVDAADYVVWRKNDGSASLYDDWRANFGISSAGAGAVADGRAVPEPGSTLLFVCGAMAWLFIRRPSH